MIIQRLKLLIYKDFMNTNLTIQNKMPAEGGSKFKGVFIFKLSANLREVSVLEDPLELNSLYARNSSRHSASPECGASYGGLLKSIQVIKQI